jgi:hypothetical protein
MGTSIGSTLQRGGGGSSPFPVAVQNDLRLPFVIVADIAARNNIEEWRRMSNMECYVISDPGGNNRYQLGVDTTLAGQNWTPTGGPFQRLSEKNQPGGYVGLEVDGYVDPVYIKSIYAQDYYTPEDETERFGLTTRTGDLARQLDNNRVYIKINNNPAPTIAADWADITTSVGISSVNGDSGPDIIIDIVGLLAYGSNQTEFDAAVAANSTVSSLAGAVSNNTSNIQDLFNAVTVLQNKTSVNIPVYNPATQYQAGNNVLYDTGSGSKSLYRCHTQPPVGTDPTDVTYWELIAGGGGTSLTKSTTVQAQVATDDATYMTPLTSYEGWFTWIVNKTVSALNTTVKNIVGAINELKTRIDNIGDVGGGSGTGVFEPVQDITELKALNTTDGAVWKDKWAILVEDEGQFYRLDRESAVSEALPQIVAPTTGVGRWIQDQKVQLDAKADKAVPTFSGNLAQLDSTGNLQDTGEQADFIDIYNDVADATKTFLNNNENWLSGTTVLDQVTVEGKAGYRYKGTDFFFECINQDTWVRFPTDAQYFNPFNIPSTEKTKLENTGNWTAKVYTGTALVNCPIGSEHYDANYYFKFVDNNTPIRIARI